MKSLRSRRKNNLEKNGIRLILLLGTTLVLGSTVFVGSVRAQAEAVISIAPSVGEIWLNAGNAIEIEILIKDVVDLQGFDLVINYDPLIVQLESWSYGDFLAPLTTVFKDESLGFIHLAAVQLSGDPASGEGILLKLSFSGLTPGESTITITDSEIGTDMGTSIEHTCQNGTILSAYDPELLPQFFLVGEVLLQGQIQTGGVPVNLMPGEVFRIGPYTTLSLDQSSENLDFGDVVADTYILTTAQPRYLNVTIDLGKSVMVSEGGSVISSLTLLAGNAVWTDNMINVADASLVGACYGMTGADLDADVNFDGVVNLQDLALVAGNYGLDSAAAYQAWMP